MKILVADDSKTTLSVVTKALEKLGHVVLTASNGHDAIEIYKNKKPDLIILDVVMEDIDGFETSRRIRAINPEHWIPIIFLSGAVDDENIARGIDAGGDDYLTKPFSEITLAAKIKAMQRISDMQHAMHILTVQLRSLSSIDTLTGVYNRHQFDKTITEKIAYADREEKSIALLFLDLDFFKLINDTLGHKIGDLLLKEAASRLHSCIRSDDFLARIGGDEFAIILNNVNDHSIVSDIAKKIINTIILPYNFFGNIVNISISIGIAFYPSNESNQEENLVQNADIAMYHAKASGRNNFQFFTKELDKKYKQKINLNNALKFSIEKNQLCLMYQPIFNLKTKKLKRIEITF